METPKRTRKRGRRPESFPVEMRDLFDLLSSPAAPVKEWRMPSASPFTDRVTFNKYITACMNYGTPEQKEQARIFEQTYIVTGNHEEVILRPRSDSRQAAALRGLIAEIEIETGLGAGELKGQEQTDGAETSEADPFAGLYTPEAEGAHIRVPHAEPDVPSKAPASLPEASSIYGLPEAPPEASEAPRHAPAASPLDPLAYVQLYRDWRSIGGPTLAAEQVRTAARANGVSDSDIEPLLTQTIAFVKAADER